MFTITSDGSIINSKGKILYFSLYRFIKDICQNNCCFICGVSSSHAKFNNEHILPNWLLKKYELHSQSITLPNGAKVRYGQYTISCCKQCNSLMGKKIEEPIYNLIRKGYKAVKQYEFEVDPWLIFNWLALIFFKTHLKDKSFKFNRDRRQGQDEAIADLYDWKKLHHIHCIARSFYTECKIDPKVQGSLLVLPATVEHDNFDYANLYTSHPTLLRVGEFAFITVLNDSCASVKINSSWLQEINSALSPLQLREIIARLAVTNLNLKKRPEFFSEINMQQERYIISANIPKKCKTKKISQSRYGQFLHLLCEDIISTQKNTHLENLVKQGRVTFLYDNKGHFITDSMKVV